MGKKKKEKGYRFYESSRKGEKGKKKGKNGRKSREYDVPKFKTIKLSLGKKDIKEAKKIVLAPVDIPKAFTKVRDKCNHAGKMITVKEFRQMTPTTMAYTPIISSLCETFGEENVRVCAACYDAIVRHECVTAESVNAAVATMYAAANKAVSMQWLKDDEIKDIAKMKNELADWAQIVDMLDKIDEDVAKRTATGGPGQSGFNPNLNDVGNSPIIG